jgi:hypothetical protein
MGKMLTNNFQGRKCMGIYFFAYLRLTKLLLRPYTLPYASRFRIHQNCILNKIN